MEGIKVGIKNISNNAIPAYATDGSSGVDARAWLVMPLILQPLERSVIRTGLFIELPQGYEVQVRSRSGLAWKQGVVCLNAPGTIDSDYRGELKIIVINLSNEPQVIHPGDRIAQLVLHKVEKIAWEARISLSDTIRGDGGFGHTGKQ